MSGRWIELKTTTSAAEVSGDEFPAASIRLKIKLALLAVLLAPAAASASCAAKLDGERARRMMAGREGALIDAAARWLFVRAEADAGQFRRRFVPQLGAPGG